MFTIPASVKVTVVALGADVDKLTDAVKSHLGNVRRESNLDKQSAKVTLKKGTAKKEPTEKVKITDTYNAEGAQSYPGCFAYFCQTIDSLAVHNLAPEIQPLPENLRDWIVRKFLIPVAIAPASTATVSA